MREISYIQFEDYWRDKPTIQPKHTHTLHTYYVFTKCLKIQIYLDRRKDKGKRERGDK